MEKGKKEVLMPVSNLEPGMIIAKDIVTRDGQFLVSENTEVDTGLIARITFFGVLSVYVLLDEEEAEEEDLWHGSVGQEKSFDQFSKKYEASIINTAHAFNQLIENETEIEEQALLQDVENIIAISDNRYQIFDMLNHLQTFDDETYMHSVNVGLICNVFADWLGMDAQSKRRLTICGLLHDIGKLLISKDILKKPGRLTEQEYAIIKEHPIRGYEFLRNRNVDKDILQVVLHHHERCDGSGYPKGLKEAEINPFVSIVAIADVYDAMTSSRVYRKSICPFQVIRIFEEDGKKGFNPTFCVPIMSKIAETYLQHDVKLSDGRKGKIVLLNAKELSRPSILVGNELVDLSAQRKLDIEQVL